MSDPATEAFLAHRNLLFTVAYEMLGSAADAEDVLQETWLRWRAVDLEEVRDQRAYLVRITTRLALNRIRSLSRRKETYVGPWLPEPLLTSPDVAEDAELADSLSTAVLLVLETLAPTERAVFVLREVFDVPYDEIAAAVDKTPAAVRQIAHRARAHVAEQRPRATVSSAEVQRVLELFRDAAVGGDIQAFMDVLAPDAVIFADGGGVVQASRNPIHGADKIIRFLSGVAAKFIPQLGPVTMDLVTVNGSPALLAKLGDQIDGAFTVRVEGGLVTALYYVRNPSKLGHLTSPEGLTRA